MSERNSEAGIPPSRERGPSGPTAEPSGAEIMSERSRNHPSQMAWMQPEEEPTGTQLRLLPGGSRRRDWELDERTREIGRRGVAEAREVLRRVEPKETPATRKAS